MQLVTFEAMLIERLNATGKVQARSFMAEGYPALYGVLVQVDGAIVPFRLTRGSGTGDPAMTEAEREAHDANVARLGEGKQPRSQHPPERSRKVEDLIRDVLAVDLPTSPLFADGLAVDRPGMKVRFLSGAEIYVTPQS